MTIKTWFITGASRGLGKSIAEAVLKSGHKVIATARNKKVITDIYADHENLLVLDLDVTDPNTIDAALSKAIAWTGCVDVLVNNAGFGQMGQFELVSDVLVKRQYEVNLFGTMDVTRKVLPLMRRQNSGHIFNISSIGGVRGYEASPIYCSSKFAVEGFSQALAAEVSPFGIKVTVVEPGFFRTDFLDKGSVIWGDLHIDDYAEDAAKQRELYDSFNYAQPGDPEKLALALLRLSQEDNPPMFFAVGPDAFEVVGEALEFRRKQLDTWADLTKSTDL